MVLPQVICKHVSWVLHILRLFTADFNAFLPGGIRNISIRVIISLKGELFCLTSVFLSLVNNFTHCYKMYNIICVILKYKTLGVITTISVCVSFWIQFVHVPKSNHPPITLILIILRDNNPFEQTKFFTFKISIGLEMVNFFTNHHVYLSHLLLFCCTDQKVLVLRFLCHCRNLLTCQRFYMHISLT